MNTISRKYYYHFLLKQNRENGNSTHYYRKMKKLHKIIFNKYEYFTLAIDKTAVYHWTQICANNVFAHCKCNVSYKLVNF